jgi:hypothetical protein
MAANYISGTFLAVQITVKRRNVMVDKLNPNSQFHPYQPVNDMPASERPTGGLGSILSKIGMGGLGGNLSNVRMGDSISKVRDYARAKPGVALGTLAALAIGAGLMRRRM